MVEMLCDLLPRETALRKSWEAVHGRRRPPGDEPGQRETSRAPAGLEIVLQTVWGNAVILPTTHRAPDKHEQQQAGGGREKKRVAASCLSVRPV